MWRPQRCLQPRVMATRRWPRPPPPCPPYLWDSKDPDLDDPLHNPDPIRDAALDRNFSFLSSRGWMNFTLLLMLGVGLLFLFAGYPIIAFPRPHDSQTTGLQPRWYQWLGPSPFLLQLPFNGRSRNSPRGYDENWE